ncbi:MAG: hypothetical protein RMM58_00260 [Chloroflexota bacterium]|nr:hypothetical protein [Dehalococcoidia bacterium]MDW8252291.1 hypothetical protein [Chloroflexota bacterium]
MTTKATVWVCGGVVGVMLALAACQGPAVTPGRADLPPTAAAFATELSAVQTQVATMLPGIQTQAATALPALQTQAANAAATATAAARR